MHKRIYVIWVVLLSLCTSISLSLNANALESDALDWAEGEGSKNQTSLDNALLLTEAIESAPLTSYVSRAVSPERIRDAEGAYQQWLDEGFKDVPGDKLTSDLQRMPEWFAFRLDYSGDELSGREWVISTQDVMHLTQLTLYVPEIHNGQPRYRPLRDTLHALEQASVGTPISGFLIQQNFDQQRPFLLKVDGRLPIGASLVLQTRSTANWESSLRVALSCLAFGVVLGLAAYNFVLFFFVRDRVYLLYVIYALSMTVWQMQISGLFFFFDRAFTIEFYEWLTPNFMAGLANLTGSMFAYSFLRLREQNRLQGFMVLLVSGINFIIGLITLLPIGDILFSYLHMTQFALGWLSACVIVIPTYMLIRHGDLFALPFFFAWGFLGTGLMFLSFGYRLEIAGVSFPVGFNVLSSMAVEMVLMSFALGIRIRGIKDEAVQLESLSITDGLTGLYNQRHLHNITPELLTGIDRRGGLLWAYCIIDIDHFKSFNDNYGHQTGDKVLITLSAIIREQIRGEDYAFRAGGEEFVLLLKVNSIDQAKMVVERIRTAFQNLPVDAPNQEQISCSLSAGMTLSDGTETAEELFGRADNALYQAKKTGRNKVIIG